VESPGKLVRKGSEARLTENICRLSRIDSLFPGNGAKMLSHSLYLGQVAMKYKAKLAEQESIPPNVTMMGRFFFFREVSPMGDIPSNLEF
jgi:hypothetical protein